MSTANYSNCIVTIIALAYRRFGKPITDEELRDMAAWVKCRVDDIRAGRAIPDATPAGRDLPSNDDAWTRY